MRRRPRGGVSPATVRAWTRTLVAGLVVAGVVWALLETLRRTVKRVEEAVDRVWRAGKHVARQTQVAHLLGATAARGAELAAELERHREAEAEREAPR